MTFYRLTTTAALLAASMFSLHAQPVPIATGVAPYAQQNGARDMNWYVTAQTGALATQEPIDLMNFPEPYIVTTVAPGWAAPQPGTAWIAPAANQSNADGALPGTCCTGTTTYETYFDGSAPTAFTIYFYADDYTTVLLNGKTIYAGGASQLYAVGASVSVTTDMIQSLNELDFIVSNLTGGPTGLDVSFATATPAGSLGASTASSDGSIDGLPEPVDAASGQYYETVSEIELGGPMNLGFRRYYSSQLLNGKVSTALGTNWMSNFDQRAAITATSAQVLLFGGKIVSFTNSGGAWQLAAPRDVLYQFISSGANYEFLDPNSHWIYSFTAAGALTAISDRNGNAITVTQGASGPTAVSDGLGRTLAFTYTSGQLAQVTDQATRTVSFTYSSGLLASVVDIYKQTTSYGYSSTGTVAGLMTHTQLPIGNIPFSQTFDSQGRVLTQRRITGNNGNAYTTSMSYDGNGDTAVTDAFGNVTKIVSNPSGNVMQLSDPSGATSTVTYDSLGRRTGVTDRAGKTTSFTYDSISGRLASVIDALGNTTSLTYLPQAQGGFTFYRLSGISYPDGTSANGTFDSNGNQLTGTAQNGAVTTYAYDTHGRPVSIKGPNQQTSSFTWNTDGTLASSADALGNKRTYSYDNTKRITSSAGPNGGASGFVWDKSATGPMLAVIYPGTMESTTIDDDGNREIARVVNSGGGVFTSDYTATGQLADFTDPLKNKTTYAYDGDDRISSITRPAGEVYTYAYDSGNRVTSISDANGPRTSFTYTPESKIATAMDGSGRKATNTYDAIGRLSTITTPGGNVYKAGYDKLGRLISRTDPLGQIQTLTRDTAGSLVSATLPGPITTSLTRDATGRVTSITTPNGNTWKIGRDALERATKYTDPLGNSTTLSFTGEQLTAATLPLGTVALTSNADGRVTQRKYSDGTTINTAYDTNRMLISADGVTIARDIAGHPNSINGIGIALDADGRPGTLTYTTGKTVTYAYDKSGRVASVTDWVGGKTTVAYDGAGRMTSLTYPNGVVTTYNYDADGNLIGIAAGTLSSITLTRDATGKITSANRSVPFTSALQAASQQFTYDSAGQLTLATSDAMGRVTTQNGRTYKWNLASQLTSFADGANSGAFTYDGLGQMSSSTVSGAAETYVYNYLLPLPALSIVRKAGNDLRYYVYFPNGTLLYSIEAAGNARHFYHFDEMGNTVLLSGDSGASTDSYSITPYGEVADHIGTADNPFTWQGQYGVIQEGVSLFYVRNRHYDASAARFISRDPKHSYDPRASEPYAYAAGNPLRFIDPFGADFTSEISALQSNLSGDSSDNNGVMYTDTNTLPTTLSLLSPTDQATVAAGLEANLADFLNTGNLGIQEDLNLEDLLGVLEDSDYQNLDWQGWIASNPIAGFAAFLATYEPTASTWTPTDPSPGQTGPVALGVPHCLTLDYCTVAAQSPTGELIQQTGSLSSLITQDGGSLIAQDGGSLITQDGGSIVSHDGGTLITQDGGTLISHLGGSFVAAPVVSHDGGGLLSEGGAGVVAVP